MKQELPPEALTWHSYLNRRMLICVFLGFSSGLPLFILLSLMQAWLAKSGLKISDIGAFEVNEAFAPVPLAWLKDLGADPAALRRPLFSGRSGASWPSRWSTCARWSAAASPRARA